MIELELLSDALKRELGAPPDAWQRAQRERVRESLAVRPERRSASLRTVSLLAAAFALASALVLGFALSGQGTGEAELTASAGEPAKPIRLEDGSTIVLTPGGRGRLVSDENAVRFDLQAGRAEFDVVPGQKRTWTITAGKNEVRVVGTRFSVAYEPSGALDVAVERGAVSVKVPERRTNVELKAGDHLHGRPGRIEVVQGSAPAPAPVVASGETPPAASGPEPVPASPSAELSPPSSTPRAAPALPALAPPSPSPSQADWRERYRDGKYAEALGLLRASGLAERLEQLPPRTLSEVAEVARLGGDPRLAARALGRLSGQFPGAPEARDAEFLLGRVHVLSGDRAAAVRAFEAYLKSAGSARYANEATGRLMELYAERGEHERARAMAERYLKQAPAGPYRRLALSLTK